MLIAKYSVVTSASPEAVWKVWSDVKNWSAWDPDVASCEIKGEFQEGAKAILKPSSGPRVHIEIINCVALESFVSKSFLPFWTSLTFEHKMKETNEGIKITHRVDLNGLAAPLFYCILGESIRQGLPRALRNLAGFAEKMQ